MQIACRMTHPVANLFHYYSAPKRPLNTYMLYSNTVRTQIRQENPEFSVGDIVSFDNTVICQAFSFFPHISRCILRLLQSKEISRRYKKISADEKSKFEAKAKTAKEKYKEEMAEYEKKKPKSKIKVVESKKKKPEPESESSESEDSDDSDDSDSESDSE